MPAFVTTRSRASMRLFDPKRIQGLPAASRSLDDVISGIWRELEGRGGASCPVCSAGLSLDRACTFCGSELS